VWPRLRGLARRAVRRLTVRFVSLQNLPVEWNFVGAPVDAVPTPEAMSMTFDPPTAIVQAPSYVPPIASVATLRSVIFHPSNHLIWTRNRRIVPESSIQGILVGDVRPAAIFRPLRNRIAGTSAVYRSRWNNYYHTVIDNVPRLHLLHHGTAAQEPDIQILIGGPLSAAEQYFLPRVLPPNARVVSLPIDQPHLIDKLLLPGFLTKHFAGYLPPNYRRWFLERVAPARPSRRDQRILISRAQTAKHRGRFMENEDEVFEALEPLGFRRYRLEAMTPSEQVNLFHDAEVVVGAHGSGLTNLVFADAANVIELFPATFVTPHYYFLCKSCGHLYRYIRGTASDRNANVTVSLPVLMRTLGGMGL